MELWGMVIALAVLVEKVVGVIKEWYGIRKLRVEWLAFGISLITLLFWRIGVLSTITETNWVWDAIVTAVLVATGSNVVHDLKETINLKKVEIQRRNGE